MSHWPVQILCRYCRITRRVRSGFTSAGATLRSPPQRGRPVPPALASSIRNIEQALMRCCFVAMISAAFIVAAQIDGQSNSSNIVAARSAMAAGISAAKAGNLLEAKLQFTRAVTLAPKIPEGHAALGSVLLSMGEFSEAVEELERAL